MQGEVELVTYLLGKGALLRGKELELAIRGRNAKLTAILIGAGASLSACQPVCRAVRSNAGACLSVLIAEGASPWQRIEYRDLSAFQLARARTPHAAVYIGTLLWRAMGEDAAWKAAAGSDRSIWTRRRRGGAL
eukprot:PLAT13723.3.p1 GENE.PLAT13723.3~~PLAT13723.3.p1  ORF type:complete len:134 (+),score=1.87 PLAT13723.3:110-511(+)